MISTHYRSKLNFTFDKLDESQKCINKLRELKRRLDLIEISSVKQDNMKKASVDNMLLDFSEKLSDDLNISGSLGVLFTWVNEMFAGLDKNEIDYVYAQSALAALKRVDSILGVIFEDEDIQSDEVMELINKRNKARDDRDWASADAIRKELDDMGVVLEDTPEGTIWKKK